MSIAPARVESDIDLFDEATLTNPYAAWRELRDLGPAAYLTREGFWFTGRYDVVRSALRDWETFSSASGIGMNDHVNAMWDKALINQDPPAHTEQRPLLTEKLSPHALKPIADTIQARADELVASLLERGAIDAVADLAHDLPVNIIMDLIGWPHEERDRILAMAAPWFETMGPANARAERAEPDVQAMMAYVHQAVVEDRLTPGGFGSNLVEAYKAGALPVEAAAGLLAGYIVAAFDTTIAAMAAGTWLFATNPEQWELVRADPDLVPNAVNEVLRLETPIQYFSRVTTRDVHLGEGVVIPEGARVMHGYGAANRDERHYPDPDRFDVRRRAADQLAFSYGRHACAGQGLAKMETTAVFTAMARHVGRVELDGDPVRQLNNTTRGFASVPVRLHPKGSS
jgi:cytochrome P450